MRISLKVLAYMWLGLFLIIGGLLFNAYSKLKPETVIALLTEQVQKNYPGTKLEVGKVDYRFSLDFNLNLQNIHLRRSGKLLGSIGKVELKVPWWLLLVNKGNAQINLSHLDIFVDHHETHDIKSKTSSFKPNEIKVTLPSYLADARYTLRAKHISVRDIHNSRRYFTVSKLLVREFQYGKNSAFELNIPIEITHGQIRYSSNLWLFGDVTPEMTSWDLNYRGEFRTKEATDKFEIEDLVIAGKATFKPQALDISSNIELLIERSNIGTGSLNANQENLSINLNFTKIPLSYFGFVYEEIHNPFLPKLNGEAEGTVKFDKKFDSDIAVINGKLSFDGNFEMSPQHMMAGKWMMSFQDSRWETSFISPKGEISFFRRSFMDMKKSKVTQFVEEVGFTGLDLNQVIAPVTSLGKVILDRPQTYFTTAISYKNCLQGDKTVNGSFKYGHSPDQKYYTSELNDGVGQFYLNYSQKSGQKALDVSFNKFRWYSSYLFLEPIFKSSSALLDGKLEGRWSSAWETGMWLGNLTANDTSDEEGLIPDLIHKTLAVFEINGKTHKQKSINFSSKNNLLVINSLLLENGDSGKIAGSLNSAVNGKSSLTLTFPKKKNVKAVKKDVVEIYWIKKEET